VPFDDSSPLAPTSHICEQGHPTGWRERRASAKPGGMSASGETRLFAAVTPNGRNAPEIGRWLTDSMVGV
jgi:hypothetical protein